MSRPAFTFRGVNFFHFCRKKDTNEDRRLTKRPITNHKAEAIVGVFLVVLLFHTHPSLYQTNIITMSGVFIVAAKRTPFGAFGGGLKTLSATELGVVSSKAAVQAAGLDPALIDAIYFGNVIQSSPDAAYLARHVGLKTGAPISSPALTLNRLCGSGFETLIQASHAIQLKEANICLSGGTENMSQAPLQVDGNAARWGVQLGVGMSMRDSLWDGLTDTHVNSPMGMTAENLGEQYDISRQVRIEFVLFCGMK
jgi:acetyl-CoA acyltransferase 2